MAQSYTAQKIYSNDKEEEVQVCSARCRYMVWLSDGEVSLFGPGVRETSEGEDYERFDSFEDFAIHTVLLFENGLWPED
ncbi:MAG: hypothetical protein KAJ19_25530 [Gammaproteobacteria bacterium]|nr:hypothetical protein [Gammaproteobacteria bacterium]